MPLVSVIVPSYNYADYIGQCIRSILNQEGFTDFELIVVDDASRDRSCEVIAAFDDPRLVFHRHETNQGHIATINQGFELARGRYLVHVGSDDYWAPDFLERCVAILEQHPRVGLVHTNYAMVEADGTIGSARATNIPVPAGFIGSELVPLLFENYFPPHGTLFRREGLEQIGGRYSADLPYSEDWRLWLAIARRWDCCFLDEVLVYYRCHDRNLHTGILRSRDGETIELRILEEVFSDPMVPPAVRRLKGEVFASHYRRYANGYFGFGMLEDCRRCLREAVAARPSLLLNRDVWRRYAAASIPRRVYRGLQRRLTGTVRRAELG